MTFTARAERVILYARVSSKHQEEQYGLRTQLDACRELAAKMGWEVVTSYQDVISGIKITRHGLDQLKEDIRDGRATAVVAYHLDRLNRDPAHHYLFLAEIKKAGARIYYASKGGRPVAETDDDEFLEGIEALVAFRERSRIRTRTLDARRNKAKAGELMGNGETPFGYRRVGEKGRYRWEVVEEEAKTVRIIFDMYLEGRGAYSIVKYLTDRRIPTPGDVRADNQGPASARVYRKRPPGMWNSTTIYKILRQPAYSGTAYTFRLQVIGETARGNKQFKERDKSEWFPFSVPAILDPATWEAAQKKLNAGKQQSPRNSKYQYLLGRHIRCGECRSAVVGKPSFKGQYLYYRCGGTRNLNYTATECDLPAVPVPIADRVAWEWITDTLLNEAALNEREAYFVDDDTAARAHIEQKRIEVAAQLSDLNLERKRLRQLYTKGRINEKEYDDEDDELNQRQESYEAELDQYDAELEALTSPEQFDHNRETAADLRIKAENADFERRREIAEELDITAKLYRDGGAMWIELVSHNFRIRDTIRLYGLDEGRKSHK